MEHGIVYHARGLGLYTIIMIIFENPANISFNDSDKWCQDL